MKTEISDSDFFADGPTGKTHDFDSGVLFGKSGLVITDPGLVHQADFRVEAVDFTGEDLFQHFSRLAGQFGIGGSSNLFFLGDNSFGDLAAADVAGGESSDVHADVLFQIFSDFAFELDQNADASVHVVIGGKGAVVTALVTDGAADLHVFADGGDGVGQSLFGSFVDSFGDASVAAG